MTIHLHPEDTRWSGCNSPRGWQRAALPLALDALVSGKRGIVRAVMGAGKSILQAEIAAALDLADDQVVLFTVPSIRLTHQLADTIEQRLGVKVGRHCTGERGDVLPINVCCHASALQFGIRAAGRRVIWIADEAHKTEATALLAALDELELIGRLGFSATPWRSSDKETVSAFDALLYDYGPGEAMADGVVVPIRVIRPDHAAEINDLCVQWATSEEPWGIVNAITIEDAESHAAELRAAGVSAEAVHANLTPTAYKAVIARHKAAETRVIVHVNMLAEGVDLPYLRWLIARRAVKSKVRFPQEVGRILRAHPGKTEARLYDPHNLWGSMALTFEMALGGARKDAPALHLPPEDLPPELRPPAERISGRVKIASPLDLLIADVRLHFNIHHGLRFTVRRPGFDPMTLTEIPSTWDAPATLAQMAALQRKLTLVGKRLPERHKPTLRLIYTGRLPLDKGQASDLITALAAIEDGAHWNV